MTAKPERSTLSRNIEVAVYVVALGLFLWAFRIDELWPRILSSVFFVVLATSRALRDRDRSGFISGGILAAATGLGIARKLAEGAGGDTALIVSVVVIVLFIAPLPLIVWLYARAGDEFQRSLTTASGAIAMTVTIATSLGYWILGRAVELPMLETLWVGLGAGAIWCVTWGALRWRVT